MSDDALRQAVGVFGATGVVGDFLLEELRQTGHPVTAFSRYGESSIVSGVEWLNLRNLSAAKDLDSPIPECPRRIPLWICTAPIWVLQEHFELMRQCGATRLVAVSSTSVIAKAQSLDDEERAISRRLAGGEERVRAWAKESAIGLILIRSTLIYGNGRDKNISEMVRFIRRFRFFPVFGKALGLRQPIHARDVAVACYAALMSQATTDREYSISGGETLPYRSMVARVFHFLGKKPRLVTVPMIFFRIAIAVCRLHPRFRQWSPAMAERMNRDLVFDHSAAAHDFGFKPSPFVLVEKDIPE